LITIKGLRALMAADVVLYDRLANVDLLIHTPTNALRIDVGKGPGECGRPRQETINALLIEHARRGRTVVRLKGGDPFVFGRGGEELVALREAGVDCEVVPGISAAIAGPGSAGIPVTHRGSSTGFAVFTAQGAGEEDTIPWESAAQMPTLVLLMGADRISAIAARLMEHGRSPETPAAIVSNATRPEQRSFLGTLSSFTRFVEPVTPPAVIVIGEVVKLATELNSKTNLEGLVGQIATN
jgi:uroporphyrin-III C-methyltransferase